MPGIYVNTARNLYRFDPTAVTLDVVGSFGCIGDAQNASITDIAIDENGRMVGTGSKGEYPYRLLEIDTSDGSCTLVGEIGDGLYPSSLTVVPRDILDPNINALVGLVEKAGGGYSTVYARFDGATGAASEIQNLSPFISGSAADLAWASDTAKLYGISQSGTEAAGAPDHLVEINPVTGTVTDLGSTGIDGFGGLAYWSGKLYGFTFKGAIYTLDRATAQATQVLIQNAPDALIFTGAAATIAP
jgi:hypothetical protein